MKASLLLAGSAVVYGAAALALLFAPQESLAALDATASSIDVIVVQLLGSALFGFALLNWMNRYSTVGGIYGRPLVIANVGHAVTAALLIAQTMRRGAASTATWALLAVYGLLALAFGAKMFGRGEAAR